MPTVEPTLWQGAITMKTFNKELMLAALAGACLSLAVPPALADPGAGELGADWYQWQET